MRNKMLKIFTAFAAVFIVLVFAETGNAQYARSRMVNVSRQQLERLIKNIETRSDIFSNRLNKSLDRSRLDGTRAEDNITDRARDLENATDRLRRHFDKNDTRADNLPEVRGIRAAGTVVNRIMIRRRFNRETENAWVNLRAEINALSRIYGLPGIGAR